MNDELKDISNKLDKMHQEYVRDKYESVGYILWGFTLAMVGLTVAKPHWVNILATVVFFIMGWVMWCRSRTVKAK
jgi:hypothetical protein